MKPAPLVETSAGITVETVIDSGDWPDVSDLLDKAGVIAWSVAGDGEAAEVSVALTDDDGIRQLNRDFRGKDKATDVLSFPAGDPLLPGEDAVLGDIALALSYIRAEAALENKSFKDHLVHLFVHGLLHLIGHDHEEAAEAAEMERLEKDILARMGIRDPYAGRELDSERQ
jgi:probable rRNA maturation factor